MPKKVNQACKDCGLNWSHEAAEQRDCFAGRACISKRSRYRNREDDLERQSAANQRRRQQGNSRRRFQLPIDGHQLPPVIKLILYRDTKESPVHAIAAEVWQDGQCIAEVDAQHTLGIHQNKLRATLNQWKAVLQTEYGSKGETKVISAATAQCPLCQESKYE